MKQKSHADVMPQKTPGGALLCAGPQEERAMIRKHASRAGAVLLVALGLQFAAAFVDIIVGMVMSGGAVASASVLLMESNVNDYVILTGIEYLVYMGVPVVIGWMMFRQRGVNVLPVAKTDGSLGVGLVLLGFGMMTAANFIGSYISLFFEQFNVSSPSVEIMQDGTPSAMWLNVLVIGIFPGLLEELLFRGVILQGLRPAGDMPALFCSALLFGLMHGTLSQIPFAFVLGLVFGYITLKTGNILWTMGLHAANNALAVLMEYWLLGMSDEQVGKFYLLFFAAETMLGVIGIAVLMLRRHPRVPPVGDRVSSWLTKGQRRRALFSAGTMIVFVVLTVMITVLGSLSAGTMDALTENTEQDTTTSASAPLDNKENSAVQAFAEVFR